MKRWFIVGLAVALVAPLLTFIAPPQSAGAVSASLWNPGNIISDANFYNGSAFTAPQIQDFLQQKVTSCAAGYTCLRDYHQSTPTMAASTLCPGGYAGSADERASDILAKVGAACNISQKVLLVLLEKEQSLVSSRSPSANAYAKATGFSCPDTAPCDPAFAGFFYQVYYAARQFQNYAQNPTHWNYQAGRVNTILYNPNAGCGTAQVYIQNKATAGLYIYTPYQPNAAALANLYGTGDSCSTYGNRNFWRIYSDWFGDPIDASSLVRTTTDTSVYLVSGGYKYPVASLAILASLSPLGVVSYVSQSYLDGLTTGHNVGRSLRGPDGSIYFYDAGVKLPFTSCAQAVDYGASCDASGYVQLTQAQIDTFQTGPVLTSVLGTVEGSRYYIKNGTKSEILDDASQTAAGIPLPMNVLSENAVAGLPLGAPIIRDGVFVLTRGTSNYTLLSGGTRYSLTSSNDAVALGVNTRVAGTLSQASLNLLPASPTTFSGVIGSATTSGVWVLMGGNRFAVTAGGIDASSVVPLPQAVVDSFPLSGTVGPGSFFKTVSIATVYIVMPTDIRPISSWDALIALTVDGNPSIYTVADSVANRFTKGPVALTAGTLDRSPGDATVYFIDGVTDRIALSDFIYPVEAGFNHLVFAHQDFIDGYPDSTRVMTFGFLCGTDRYVAAGGQVHLVDPSLWALYPIGDFVPYDIFTCRNLKIGAPAGQFLRTPDGTIYQLTAGMKHPVSSLARFNQLAQGQGWLNVVWKFADLIPTGPPV